MQFRQLAACGFGLLSAFLTSVALAEEPAAAPPPVASPPVASPPPAADVPPPGARTTHIVAGAATTVVSYGLAVGASFLIEERDFNGSKDLRIPLAGPWMALGKAGCPESSPNCSTLSVVIGALFLIAEGVTQAGGLAVIGEGLLLNTSSKDRPKEAEGPTVRALPLQLGKGGAGLGFVGTF